jgi:hypothetical protein
MDPVCLAFNSPWREGKDCIHTFALNLFDREAEGKLMPGIGTYQCRQAAYDAFPRTPSAQE